MAIGRSRRKPAEPGARVGRWGRRRLLAFASLLVLGATLIGCNGPLLAALHAPALAGPPPAVRVDDPPAGLISLEAARASVARFSAIGGGDQTATLNGGLDSGSFGGRSYAIYNLESATGEQTFKVDARTGEVLEANRSDRLVTPGQIARLSQVEAERQATSLAADRFEGFRQLSLVERRSARAANDNLIYTFKWAQLAPESGAELPTTVSLSLTEAGGALVWYLAQRAPVEVPVQPAIGREQAIASAVTVADRGNLWNTTAPSSVRLQVIYDDNNRQRLIWAVTFPRRPDGPPSARPTLRVQLDAQSGQPLESRG